jgi:hypothetical protein
MFKDFMSILEFRDANLQLLALVIKGEAKVSGVSFLTNPENELQLGLMTRDTSSPVLLHKHNSISRTVHGTQEVILIRSGSARIKISDEKLESVHEFVLAKGDAVLLLQGLHAIDFLETTEILEIKQGPYAADLDKTYI